ncbi:uncharacterized protein LOC144627021 [Crassostrea virginica]
MYIYKLRSNQTFQYTEITMAKSQTMAKIVIQLSVLVLGIGSVVNGKCQSGNIRAFDYPQAPKYPVRETIQFDPPFDETPAMMYALNFIDVNYAENFRVNSSLIYVDRYRAQLQMSTWHDTKLYGIGLSWMACP